MHRTLARPLLAVLLLLSLAELIGRLDRYAPDDLGYFLASGRAFADGLNPYTNEPGYNVNPPLLLYPFRWLAALGHDTAHLALKLASVGLYAGTCAMLLRRFPEHRTPLKVLWLAVLGGFWHTLYQGQIYMFLVTPATAAFLLLGWRPILAGVLIGLVIAIKPNLAVWPLFLLLSGQQRPALTAGVTAGALTLLPLPFVGLEAYSQYVTMVMDIESVARYGNSSLPAALAGFGISGIDWLVALAVILPLAFIVWRVKPSPYDVSALAVCAALLASPYTWPSYLLFLLPVLLLRRWHRPEEVVAVLLALSFWLTLDKFVGLAYFAALLIVLGVVLVPLVRRPTRTASASRSSAATSLSL